MNTTTTTIVAAVMGRPKPLRIDSVTQRSLLVVLKKVQLTPQVNMHCARHYQRGTPNVHHIPKLWRRSRRIDCTSQKLQSTQAPSPRSLGSERRDLTDAEC